MPRRQDLPSLQPASLPASLVANIRPPQPLNVHGDRFEEWSLFEQQFDWYSAATSLASQPENIQIAVFMSTLGPEAVKEFNSLKLSPTESQRFSSIKTALRHRFAPSRNFRFERYLFNKITQHLDEKFDSFLTRIVVQAKKCNFGDLLDDLVIDRIIFGTKDDQLRTKLLDIDPLTFIKATTLCRSAESVKEQSKLVASDSQQACASTASVAALKSLPPANRPDYTAPSFPCKNCGTTHVFRNCPAYGKTCSYCHRRGHFVAQCRSKQSSTAQPNRSSQLTSSQYPPHAVPSNSLKKVAEATVDCSPDPHSDELYVNSVECSSVSTLSDILYVNSVNIFSLATSSPEDEDWFETLTVANQSIRLKLDSGAQCNVLPQSIVDKISTTIQPSFVKRIASFSDTSFKLPVLGEVHIRSKFKSRPDQEFYLSFLVVAENVAPILGRKSCVHCGFIRRVLSIENQSWDDIRSSFQTLFNGLGFVPAFPYDAVLVDNPKLNIYPARRIPFKIQAPVKAELDLMEKLQVIRPISEPTPVVSPMVVIQKGGKIKIGLDPSDINKNLKRHHHPLRTVEEIAAKVSNSKFFTVLDCFKGYWQIPLSERTQKLLTFSTPWGRYSCLRLPYGIASAPEIFQKIMSSLFQDMPQVEISMDDILVHAPTETELKNITCAVLSRLQEAGFKLNPQKCIFGAQQVKFLGHIFSSAGLLPDPSKIAGINALKTPSSVQELQRFLGSVTYLGKFIPNLSQLTEPLRKLLKKETIWDWTEEQQNAFSKLKLIISSSPVLKFFDVHKPVVLSVDASSKALGAVLLQEGQPVAYATRALSDSQTYLPQIEKEALAVRFACEKFHDYIYGKPLTIESDHKPLESIFKKPIFRAPPRLKRILLDVAMYNPQLVYTKGKNIPIPDLLSRDCLSPLPPPMEELEVLLILPISASATKNFQTAIKSDEELQLLISMINSGWPPSISQVPLTLRKYFSFREDLSVHEDLLLKGDQLFVPATLRHQMLPLIHQGHIGTDSCIKRAKEALFWPGMSTDISNFVARCTVCQSASPNKPPEPLILKEVPARPWQLVASDIFQLGPIHYLLLVDSYSGFVEVKELRSLTSQAVIKAFKTWFSVHGIPEYLDTDGGTQFTSTEFQEFCKTWNFTHRTSSPHYPKSNGLAERNVATIKNILRKCQLDKSDPFLALLNWRNTPRSPTLPSPSERLMSRKTKTLLPISPHLLLPKVPELIQQSLEAARQTQKTYADVVAQTHPDFSVGQSVMLRTNHRTWIPAKVIRKLTAPRSYEVVTQFGHHLRRNSSFLRRTSLQFVQQPPTTSPSDQVPATSAAVPFDRPRRTIRPPQRLDL